MHIKVNTTLDLSHDVPDVEAALAGAQQILMEIWSENAELTNEIREYFWNHGIIAVVEDCVNGVGVDVNTASAQLLTKVSGLSEGIANNIIEFRNKNGAFKSRSRISLRLSRNDV